MDEDTEVRAGDAAFRKAQQLLGTLEYNADAQDDGGVLQDPNEFPNLGVVPRPIDDLLPGVVSLYGDGENDDEVEEAVYGDEELALTMSFAKATKTNGRDPLKLLETYLSHCSDVVDSEEQTKVAQFTWEANEAARRLRVENLENARRERDTWELLRFLHEPRAEAVEEDFRFESQAVNHTKTVQAMIDVVYRRDVDFQLAHRVTQWFQWIERRNRQSIRDVYRFQDASATEEPPSGAYWPKTLRYLDGKGSFPHQYSVDCTLHVDPDAPLREGKTIHPDDFDDETKLVRQLWWLLRAGAFYHAYTAIHPDEVDNDSQNRKLQQPEGYAWYTHEDATERAIALCKQYGQPWRAASLLGGKPEEVCYLAEAGETLVRRGNIHRCVWKEMCLKLAHRLRDVKSEKEKTKIEMGIYALMAGDFNLVLASPLCKGWYDQCWARFRCLVQARVDLIAIEHRRANLEKTPNVPGPINSTYEDAVSRRARDLSARLDSPACVFRDVRVASNSKDPEGIFPIIQAAIIQGTFGEILEDFICPIFCGEEWQLLPLRTIIAICGVEFVKDHSDEISESYLNLLSQDEGLDPERAFSFENSDVDSQDCKCWREFKDAAPLLFRFVTHLALYFDEFESTKGVISDQKPVPKVAVLAVLTSYVRYLIADQKFQAVSCYFQYLPKPLCHALYSAMLESLVLAPDNVYEKCTLEWAQDIGREDLYMMVRQVVRNIRIQWRIGADACKQVRLARVVDDTHVAANELSFAKSAEENMEWKQLFSLIKGWKWLMNDRQSRLEGLIQANCICRDLLPMIVEMAHLEDDPNTTVHHSAKVCWKAVVELLSLIDEEETNDVLFNGNDDQVILTNIPTENVWREFRSWKLYVIAHEAMKVWREKMMRIEDTLQRSWDMINTSRPDGANESHKDRVEQAIDMISETVEETETKLLAVLEYPEGWLCDTELHSVDQIDQETQSEVNKRAEELGSRKNPGTAKKVCLPPLLNLYHSLLHHSAEKIQQYSRQSKNQHNHDRLAFSLFKRSLQVADIAANEDYALYRALTPKDAHALLSRVRQSALQLLRLQGQL